MKQSDTVEMLYKSTKDEVCIRVKKMRATILKWAFVKAHFSGEVIARHELVLSRQPGLFQDIKHTRTTPPSEKELV